MVPPAVVEICCKLRSCVGSPVVKGLVMPTMAVTLNVPIVPDQRIWPGVVTEIKPVAQVTPGLQLPPKVTVPVESIVIVLPASSEILSAGGVVANNGDTNPRDNTAIRNRNSLNFRILVMFILSALSFG